MTNIFSTSNSWSIKSAKWLATAATDARKPSASTPPPAAGDPSINRIVDDISGLTLLQAADLVSLLKVRNIQLLSIKIKLRSFVLFYSHD